MSNRLSLLVLSAALLLSSLPACSVIQSLRRDVDQDTGNSNNTPRASDYEYYKDPANRFVPPPPANANDAQASILSGTPVDLSGNRAKQMRVTAKDFTADTVKNENSLWAEDGQSNYLFARNKLKMPGDLVTVLIEDNLRKDMVDSVKKLLPPEYRDQEIRVPGLTKDQADASANPTPQATPSAADPSANDMLTAEVLERFPNGNVRLRGIKRVPFKHQVRNIEVLAIVKANEINEQDVVKSSKFFDQRVELYR